MKERCKPDDLSIRRVLAQVLQALIHLHGIDIIHADVKPDNIFIDGQGLAHLGCMVSHGGKFLSK